MVANTRRVLAIELFNSAQALDFRRPAKSSPVIEAWHADFRRHVPFIENDCVMYPHIAAAVDFIC